MAAILRMIWDAYLVLFNELPDPRTKSWFLVAKPYQTLTLLGLYLMFVLKWGPKYMRNRKPFKLDKILIAYNLMQVVACTYLFINCILVAWGWEYKWICEPVDFSNSDKAIRIASFVYFYYVLKIIDLMDTVFFVLRKKGNQVSFLHIYHHTGMVLLIWGAVTYLPGGHATLVGVINTFVHIVMYSYYLYCVLRPKSKRSVWWKKHITQLQILQFFICVVHMVIIVFKPDCAYPRWTSAVFLPQNCFMLVLFIDFYIKTYVRKPVPKQNVLKDSENNDIIVEENSQKRVDNIEQIGHTAGNTQFSFTNNIECAHNSHKSFLDLVEGGPDKIFFLDNNVDNIDSGHIKTE